MLAQRPDARVVYVSGERFVSDMVSALQQNRIDAFKTYYRNLDLLLVDDIQFLAGKERSQEEFFHVFNSMLESKNQLVMSCDRYPRDIKGLEDRLKSRFGWGLSVAVEPPDMETRVAILLSKAELADKTVPQDVAFFIARRVHSNVRELEGALRTVIAYATLTHAPISLELTREALKDIVKAQDRQVTLEAILKAIAEYYRVRGERPDLPQPQAQLRTPAPGRHGPGQGTDLVQPAGDRRGVWRARPHHRAVRLRAGDRAAP